MSQQQQPGCDGDDTKGFVASRPGHTVAEEREAARWNAVLGALTICPELSSLMSGSGDSGTGGEINAFDVRAQRRRARQIQCITCTRRGSGHMCEQCTKRRCCVRCKQDMQDEIDETRRIERSVFEGPIQQHYEFMCHRCVTATMDELARIPPC